MNGVEVEFVGGPFDGRRQVFPEADPPPMVHATEPVGMCQLCRFRHRTGAPCVTWDAADPIRPVDLIVHEYRLRPSPRDEGPLWLLVYEGCR